jgi:xylan 1,4-beta-xylosidase
MPVLNVFRMFGKMGSKRVAAESSGELGLETVMKDGVRGRNVDVGALASAGPGAGRVTVMVWHYHDDDLPGPDAVVDLRVSGLGEAVREAGVTEYRIDETHSNAYAVWRRMGSPTAPNPEQYRQMMESSALTAVGPAAGVKVEGGAAGVRVSLPRQGVALFVVEGR